MRAAFRPMDEACPTCGETALIERILIVSGTCPTPRMRIARIECSNETCVHFTAPACGLLSRARA